MSVILSGIQKSFGETKALVDANLAAEPAQIHAIVGENGSGKSTLAKIISGITRPDAGSVSIFGQTPTSPRQAIRCGVATVFQEILLAEHLTVLENLFAGRDTIWRKTYSERDKRRMATELLGRLVSHAVDLDAEIFPLPLPVKQWIVIARALLSKPRLLIFDESSAALDMDATSRLHDEMRRLKAEGSTILIVTHRIAELVRIADIATVLRDGVTVGTLSKNEITEDRIVSLMSAGTVSLSATSVNRGLRSSAVALQAKGVRSALNELEIDFELRAGEIVGLTGLDGAGHVPFAQILAGILRPSKGEVHANGDLVKSLVCARSAGIEYVSGDRKREGIFPRLSIIENFGMAIMGRHARQFGFLDFEKRSKEFSKEASRLSLKFGRDDDRITTLSGGNQQKVLIARAFAKSPKIIVLNDPARGVDIGTKQDLYRHLKAFAESGGAVVYLSSEIEEFIGFADRVEVFFEGDLFASLTDDRIEERHILAALFGRNSPEELSENNQEKVA